MVVEALLGRTSQVGVCRMPRQRDEQGLGGEEGPQPLCYRVAALTSEPEVDEQDVRQAGAHGEFGGGAVASRVYFVPAALQEHRPRSRVARFVLDDEDAAARHRSTLVGERERWHPVLVG